MIFRMKIKNNDIILKKIKTQINIRQLTKAKGMDFCRYDKIEEGKIFKKST